MFTQFDSDIKLTALEKSLYIRKLVGSVQTGDECFSKCGMNDTSQVIIFMLGVYLNPFFFFPLFNFLFVLFDNSHPMDSSIKTD